MINTHATMRSCKTRAAGAGLLHARPHQPAEVRKSRVSVAGCAGRPEALKQLPHARQHAAKHPLHSRMRLEMRRKSMHDTVCQLPSSGSRLPSSSCLKTSRSFWLPKPASRTSLGSSAQILRQAQEAKHR